MKLSPQAADTNHWERIYGLPLANIPWEIEEPPQELVDLPERGLLSFYVEKSTLNSSFASRSPMHPLRSARA